MEKPQYKNEFFPEKGVYPQKRKNKWNRNPKEDLKIEVEINATSEEKLDSPPNEKKSMRIITVNLPIEMIEKMKQIVKKWGLYPSRSELVRVATRDFLIEELKNLKQYEEHANSDEPFILHKPSGTIDMRTIRFVRDFNAQRDD